MDQKKSALSSEQENRTYPPSEDFRKGAHINSDKIYEQTWLDSKNNRHDFWAKKAKEFLFWDQDFQSVLKWNPPHATWFEEGTLNISANCIDRHLKTWRRNKVALIWEGEPGDTRTLSYQDLYREVSKFSHALEKLGLRQGDCVSLYLPMIPEAVIAMLACARIGAIHNVVFAGFSSDALAERNNDCKAKLVITADGGWRKGSQLKLKEQVDEALIKSPSVKSVIVVNRCHREISMQAGRDHWWHEITQFMPNSHIPKSFPAENSLFVLYTSGSTGKPKGVLHSSAGYFLGAALSFHYVFDHKDEDVFWCTADIGWITGHSYIVYGPLANGATILMYEGAPTTPDPGRFWELIEKYRVTTLYTAPTAIRTFMKLGEQWPRKYDLSSLRLLGSVGEPINPKAWTWYHEVIGGGRCPIVDTWWQTETGSIMLSPLPGQSELIPGCATQAMFGVVPEVVDHEGNLAERGAAGFLVITQPWPSMLRGIFGDPERYEKQYWSQVPGKYFTGDGARQDSKGRFWIMGRVDDVLNVSGHRLSTIELESALVSHEAVSEAAVVGVPHDVKGEGIFCFVTLSKDKLGSDELKDEIIAHVIKQIGALARPDFIRFAETLPKTRSGKIMRRLLRDIAKGVETKSDTSTLEDSSILAALREED